MIVPENFQGIDVMASWHAMPAGLMSDDIPSLDAEDENRQNFDEPTSGIKRRDSGTLALGPEPLGLPDGEVSHGFEGNMGSPLESLKQLKTRATRRRTSKYCGVCSANRKNQWQARILMLGKVTHLGYFDSEEEAARVYDVVALSLNRDKANTNFPIIDYTTGEYAKKASKLSGLTREELQRSLGVKPITKTSRFNGVSKKRGKWVAKVMIDKKLKYHASFENETEAALAYDAAVRRLKPNKAHAYVNFKNVPAIEMGQFSVDGTAGETGPGLFSSALQPAPQVMMPYSDVRPPWNASAFPQDSLQCQQLQGYGGNQMKGPTSGFMPQHPAACLPPQCQNYQHQMPLPMSQPSNANTMQPSGQPMPRHAFFQSDGAAPNRYNSQPIWGFDHSRPDTIPELSRPSSNPFGNMNNVYTSTMPSTLSSSQELCYHPVSQQQQSVHGMWELGLHTRTHSPLDTVLRPGVTAAAHVQSLIQPPMMCSVPMGQHDSTTSSTWTTHFGATGDYEAISQPRAVW